jgi:cytochrome P450
MDNRELAELLPRWDIFDAEHEKARHDVLRYARGHCPVPWTEGAGGFFLVTRFEDVQRVALDWETFSSTEGLPTPMPLRICPIDADPPLQTALRQILNPLFSRGHLLRYVPLMEQVAAELVDKWADSRRCELVADFAADYVGTILMRIVMGDMEPEAQRKASDAVLGASHEGTPENFFTLVMTSAERLAVAEADPENAPDVLRAVINAEVEENGQRRPLTEEERLGVLNILFLGGLDTTRAAITMMALEICADPSLEQRVRNPDWVRHDLDEFLRMGTPVGTFGRVATRDVELNGTLIKKGQRLLVRYDSANRDESRFSNPDQLVFDPPRPSNAAFSLGIHRCLGSNLARLQIPIAWEAIFRRVTNLRLTCDPAEIIWEPGLSNGPRTVPLAFDKL